MKLSDAQKIRAARAILGWNQKDVAEHAGVSINTVVNMEKEGHRAMHQNRIAVFRALLIAGIDFTDNGVYLHPHTGVAQEPEQHGSGLKPDTGDAGPGCASLPPEPTTSTVTPEETAHE